MFKKYFLPIWFALTPLGVGGQTVGLVMSGGGAKGLAHIGVIKALEEHQIPIDYVGGTSAGAIVGSLYAMGLNADDMMRIVRSEEFSYWMHGMLENEFKYYFKTEFPGPDLFSVGLDVKDTIPKTMIPLSLIPNHLMDFAFMEIYARASAAAHYDFDSLFVPFLCVSADISNSKEEVFRKGDLSQAVRASMTFPLYFRPILIGGNIMYDGGIYNNFPSNHVKEHFKPDVIIGSKTAEGNSPPDEFDIMRQIENMVMKPSDYTLTPGEGILIDMDFERTSLLAFDKLEEFVELGYQSTLLLIDSIKMLVHRKAPLPAELEKKREAFIGSWPELRFGELDINGLNEKQTTYVERSIRKTDSVIDVKELKQEYLKLANDQSLFYLYPQAIYNQRDSLFKLRLRIIPKAPLEARFGLFFSTTGIAQTHLGFSYRAISEVSTHLSGSIQFGRLYNGVNLGFRFDYPSRIPLFFQGSFNYNGFDFNSYHSNFFFADLKPSYIVEDEINFRFDVGIPYSMNGVIKGGIGIGRNREVYYMTKDFTSNDTSEISNVNLVSLYLAGERNSFNNKQFATEGTLRKLGVRVGYGLESYVPGSTSQYDINEKLNYFWLSAKYEDSGFIPLKGRFSLGYHYIMQATFKPLLSNYFSSLIDAPAFKPNVITKGMFLEQYRAYQFIAAGLMPLYTFNKQIHAKMEAYAFFPVQEILRDESNRPYKGTYFHKMKSMFNASLNFVSVAGPVSFHVGYLTEEENPWVFQLSFGYLLFNKRSTDE